MKTYLENNSEIISKVKEICDEKKIHCSIGKNRIGGGTRVCVCNIYFSDVIKAVLFQTTISNGNRAETIILYDYKNSRMDRRTRNIIIKSIVLYLDICRFIEPVWENYGDISKDVYDFCVNNFGIKFPIYENILFYWPRDINERNKWNKLLSSISFRNSIKGKLNSESRSKYHGNSAVDICSIYLPYFHHQEKVKDGN